MDRAQGGVFMYASYSQNCRSNSDFASPAKDAVKLVQMNDIQKELASLKGEQEQHAKDSSQYSGLERTYEGLLTAVKTLEGTLADHNLAMDKARTTADPGEVASYLQELEDRNSTVCDETSSRCGATCSVSCIAIVTSTGSTLRNARDLDNIFLMKQEREKGVAQIEHNIGQIHHEMEGQIDALGPQKVSSSNFNTELLF
eukprot:12390-Heterococcus_DN1.PRE.2